LNRARQERLELLAGAERLLTIEDRWLPSPTSGRTPQNPRPPLKPKI